MVCTFGGSRFGADFCCLVWLGFGVCRFVVFWVGVLGVVSGVLHGLVCIGLRIFMFACRWGARFCFGVGFPCGGLVVCFVACLGLLVWMCVCLIVLLLYVSLPLGLTFVCVIV